MIAVGFYVPLVLITILYLTIALTIKSQKTAGEQSVSRRGQPLKREKIVLKISIAIVSAFTMGWLPLSIWWFVYFYSSDKTVIWSCGFRYFTEIVRFLMYSYCAVNPCICFIFIGHYRQALKNLLRCFSMAPSANQVAPLQLKPYTIKCYLVAMKDKFRNDRFNQNLRKVSLAVKKIFLAKVLS